MCRYFSSFIFPFHILFALRLKPEMVNLVAFPSAQKTWEPIKKTDFLNYRNRGTGGIELYLSATEIRCVRQSQLQECQVMCYAPQLLMF